MEGEDIVVVTDPEDIEEEIKENINKKSKTYTYTNDKTGKTKTIKRVWTNKTDRELRRAELNQFFEDNEEWLATKPKCSEVTKKFNEKMNYDTPMSHSVVYKSYCEYCDRKGIQRNKRSKKTE